MTLFFLLCSSQISGFSLIFLQDIADPTEYPGIYIKVGSYLEWISAVLNADARKNLPTKEN